MVVKDPIVVKVVKQLATKQLLINTPATILTLHLKRFAQRGYHIEKVNKHVSFPLILDMAPFCGKSCTMTVYDNEEIGIKYSLFGVVEHSGRMGNGHYTSYVKVGLVLWVKESLTL